jgi:hypothetical protein
MGELDDLLQLRAGLEQGIKLGEQLVHILQLQPSQPDVLSETLGPFANLPFQIDTGCRLRASVLHLIDRPHKYVCQ